MVELTLSGYIAKRHLKKLYCAAIALYEQGITIEQLLISLKEAHGLYKKGASYLDFAEE
jgi:hypothetical protein